VLKSLPLNLFVGTMPFKLKTPAPEKGPIEVKSTTPEQPPAKKPRGPAPNVSSLVMMEKLATPQRPARLPTTADMIMAIYKAAFMLDNA